VAGRASLQFVPTPTEPTLESVELGEIPLSDGSTREGFILRGTGFSEAAIVLVDGEDIRSIPSAEDPAVASYATSTNSHEAIFVITQDPENLARDLTRTFTVVNPYDRRTQGIAGSR